MVIKVLNRRDDKLKISLLPILILLDSEKRISEMKLFKLWVILQANKILQVILVHDILP